MFEKIGRYAETVATSASLSRRGFLNRLSQAALGVAGLVGALLISPGKAGASPGLLRRCTYCCPDGSLWVKYCPCVSSIKHASMTCPLCSNTCGY